MVVGRLLSYREGNFSGAMLNLGGSMHFVKRNGSTELSLLGLPTRLPLVVESFVHSTRKAKAKYSLAWPPCLCMFEFVQEKHSNVDKENLCVPPTSINSI